MKKHRIAKLLKTDVPAPHDLLWQALLTWPEKPGKALLRSAEAQILGNLKWKSPVLDFGCGDGEVTALLQEHIDVGLDLNFNETAKALSTAIYGSVINGNGCYLPFPSSYFGTIISNSVLEHVDNLELVLSEIFRTLQSGSYFLFTTPSPHKEDNLFFSQIDGDAYKEYFNNYWEHKNCLPEKSWEDLLEKVGFTSIEISYYENWETSQLIDLLYSVRLKYVEREGYSLPGDKVKEVWIRLIYNLLYPYFSKEADSDSGGFIVKAFKPAL